MEVPIRMLKVSNHAFGKFSGETSIFMVISNVIIPLIFTINKYRDTNAVILNFSIVSKNH